MCLLGSTAINHRVVAHPPWTDFQSSNAPQQEHCQCLKMVTCKKRWQDLFGASPPETIGTSPPDIVGIYIAARNRRYLHRRTKPSVFTSLPDIVGIYIAVRNRRHLHRCPISSAFTSLPDIVGIYIAARYRRYLHRRTKPSVFTSLPETRAAWGRHPLRRVSELLNFASRSGGCAITPMVTVLSRYVR